MGLNRFQQCNPNHRDNFQYCCLKSQLVFCGQCWRQKAHGYQCHSTRCGHFEKLAHLTIDKTLEMKSLYYIAQMSTNHEKCSKTFMKFLQLKQYISQVIKEDIMNKLPLFLDSFLVEMLGSRSVKSKSLLYEEGTCSEMLKIIKNKQGNEKSECLQAAVNGFEKISHMYESMKHNIKEKNFEDEQNQEEHKSQNSEQKLDKIYRFYHDETLGLINSIKNSIKTQIQQEIKQLLTAFDPSIEFDGVKFNSKPNFSAFENFKPRNLVLQAYPDLQREPESVYMGINVDCLVIQETPELLLETSKNFLKNKLYDMYSQIQQFKSPFPYKFAYVIATTVVPDRQYELSIIDLEKAFVKKVNKLQKTTENAFMNSVNLVIMGPELIIIQFRNRPRNTAIISIYNHKEERVKFYEEVLEKLGFKKSNQLKKIEHNYKFQSQLTSVGLVYAELEIAYEHLFLDNEQGSKFQGQKYAQARGSSLFAEITQKYKETAHIDFQITRNINQIQKLII